MKKHFSASLKTIINPLVYVNCKIADDIAVKLKMDIEVVEVELNKEHMNFIVEGIR